MMEFQVALLVVVVFSMAGSPGSTLDPPTSGLFFNFEGSVLLPNGSIHIEDIGRDVMFRNNPESALICNTTNVNTNCCRNIDNNNEGPIGNWFYPNDSRVISNGEAEDNDVDNLFVRIGFETEVRLVTRGTVTGPLGRYSCRVPNEDGETVNASINITSKSTSTVIPPMAATMAAATAATTTTTTTTTMATTTTTTTTTNVAKSTSSNSESITTVEISSSSSNPMQSVPANRITSIPVTDSTTPSTTVDSSGPSTSSSTPVIIIVVIIIVIVAIVVVVVLILLFHKRLWNRVLSKYCSNYTKSTQHTDGNIRKFSKEMSDFNTYDDVDSNPKKKAAAVSGTQSSPNVSDTYAVPDKRGQTNGNPKSENPNISEMYAVVDKSDKTKQTGPTNEAVHDNSNIADMYAVVDKTAKTKANASDDATETPNLSEMYAVVDKSAKKKANSSVKTPDSSNLSNMYAVVDKTAKKKKSHQETNTDQDISEMYSVVDKSAKTRNANK